MRSIATAAFGGSLLLALSLQPSLAASPAPPAFTWQGFYVGADVGYGLGSAKASTSAFGSPLDTDFIGGRGFIGGILGGYNYMVMPRTLVGIEADANWSTIAHTDEVQDNPGNNYDFKTSQKQAYSVRARFGYLLAPETLFYGTAGWSWSQFEFTASVTGFGTDSDTLWLNGPQVGAGVETMLAPGWMARLEYLHTFYNGGTFNSSVLLAGFGSGVDVRPSIGVGRLALIYNFAPGTPSPGQAATARPSWNGVYVGAALGAGVANAKIEFTGTSPNSIDGIGIPGVLPTALIGYDWRVAPRWVVGVEGEVAPGISTADFAVDWTAAVRGRGGYLLTPATLVYGSVGWITTGIRTTSIISDLVTVPSQRVNAIGFGGGVETAINDHWLARFDYQYAVAAPVHGISVDVTGFTTGMVDARAQFHIAKLGLVYLLDGTAPLP
ncbi:MAG TPA: outer membrane beta-barrel protein [Pseudolabrys sp.]|nr:outer membrane beta-barrel protein [Pseudolabrys sp.]